MENYTVYSDGRIYSKRNDRFLKPGTNNDGYLQVSIAGKKLLVHRLVAQKFIMNSNNLPQVDHKDGNRQNNDMSNLRWVTNMTNTQSINSCREVGNWRITKCGTFEHRITVDGTLHSKTFENFSEMQFYNLIIKYCLYNKYRKDYEIKKDSQH